MLAPPPDDQLNKQRACKALSAELSHLRKAFDDQETESERKLIQSRILDIEMDLVHVYGLDDDALKGIGE